MKRLIIVRHAKSNWEFDIADKDRPLMPHGVERAKQHAKLLKEQLNEVPGFWASSYAMRALHTGVIFATEFKQIENLKIQKSLYTFSAWDLMKAIAEFPNQQDFVILFAHNDACHQVIMEYTGEYLSSFKTASVAFIEFDQNDWKEIANGKLKFIISKEEIQ